MNTTRMYGRCRRAVKTGYEIGLTRYSTAAGGRSRRSARANLAFMTLRCQSCKDDYPESARAHTGLFPILRGLIGRARRDGQRTGLRALWLPESLS